MGGGLTKTNRGRTLYYDFRRPDKFSREQIITMQIMHDTFCRLALSDLAQYLGIATSMEVACVDQLTWEEFIRSRPNPDVIGIVAMDPLKGHAALEIDPDLASLMIQRLAGIPESSLDTGKPHRISLLEQELLDGLFVRLFGHLREAWTPVLDLKPRLAALVDVPSFAQIVPPSEMVILVTLKVTMGGLESMMNLVFPFITIEPIISRLSASWMYRSIQTSSPPVDPAQGYRVQDRRMPLEAVVDGPRLKLGDLLGLRPGSLVPLENWDSGEVWIQGVSADPGLPECLLGKVRVGLLSNNETADIIKPHRYLRLSGPGRKRAGRLTCRVEASGQWEIQRILGADKASGNPVDGEFKLVGEESANTPAVSRDLEALGGRFEQALTGLGQRLDDLVARQERLADQLLYGAGESGLEAENLPPPAVAHTSVGLLRPNLDWIQVGNAPQVAQILGQEPACIAALVLGAVEDAVAARLLEDLEVEQQTASLAALARQETVRPEVMQVLDRVLGTKLSREGPVATDTRAKGMDKVVGILNLVNRQTEKQVIESFDVSDPVLSEEVKQNMFVFEDMVLVDDRGIRRLLDLVDRADLARALKNVSAEVLEKFTGNMKPEEASALKKSIEALGPLYMKDIDGARQKIIGLLRQLETEGAVVIAHSGSDEVVV